jgi:hypothetical protein
MRWRKVERDMDHRLIVASHSSARGLSGLFSLPRGESLLPERGLIPAPVDMGPVASQNRHKGILPPSIGYFSP